MRFITIALVFLLTSFTCRISMAHNRFEISPFESMDNLNMLEQRLVSQSNGNEVLDAELNPLRIYLYPRFARECKLLYQARQREGMIIHQNDIVLGPASAIPDVTDVLQEQSGANKVLVAGLGLKLLSGSSFLWPDGIIPYTIDEELKGKETVILQAIKEWNEKTNVTFVHYELEGDWLRNHFGYNAKIWRIHFVASDKNSSSSYVGLRKYSLAGKDKAQGVWLSKNSGRDTVLHELGHAIGLWHEHNRPDRDQYIKILEENIQKDHVDQYDIDSESIVGDYDFVSIMHYSQSTFAKDGKASFSLANGVTGISSALIGNVQHISRGDIEAVNAMYRRKVYHSGPFLVPGDKKDKGKNTATLSEVDYTELEIDERYHKELKALVVSHLKITEGDVADFECKRAPVGTLDIIKCVVTLKNKKKYAASIHAGTGTPYVMFVKTVN